MEIPFQMPEIGIRLGDSRAESKALGAKGLDHRSRAVTVCGEKKRVGAATDQSISVVGE